LTSLVKLKAASGEKDVVLLGPTAAVRRLLSIAGMDAVFILKDQPLHAVPRPGP